MSSMTPRVNLGIQSSMILEPSWESTQVLKFYAGGHRRWEFRSGLVGGIHEVGRQKDPQKNRSRGPQHILMGELRGGYPQPLMSMISPMIFVICSVMSMAIYHSRTVKVPGHTHPWFQNVRNPRVSCCVSGKSSRFLRNPKKFPKHVPQKIIEIKIEIPRNHGNLPQQSLLKSQFSHILLVKYKAKSHMICDRKSSRNPKKSTFSRGFSPRDVQHFRGFVSAEGHLNFPGFFAKVGATAVRRLHPVMEIGEKHIFLNMFNL